MKKPILALLVFASQLAFSQGISVVSNEQLPIPSGSNYLPVLSPAGDFLVLTNSDMNGLQKYDLATKKMTTLTTDKGSGFGVEISSDGSTVVYRNREYKGKLRYTTLKSVNVNTGKKSELVKATRDLQGVAVKEGTVLAVNDGKLLSKKMSGSKLSRIPAVASIKDGQLYVTVDGTTRQVSPAGTEVSYLWPSVSPDGKKLLYYVMDYGKAYVSNLDGSNPVSLGVMRAPKWMGNDWTVGMVDYDNGEIVTSSKIVAVSANGKVRTDLTDESSISMYPCASADASKIVYNTADGKVFLMQVKTTK
ncbi:PD40 domain-containing protein [Barnesiella propionica]|uniref:PD40 domain-containing protein n=1 Tax=Barnesiella propionica TaxID=2981781 RepID=UPI0011CB659F|nr:PD40 domain-containing protein [Barnesiella propionica]MCU6769202.1 PD40 domain-containing protein [Barnesiella propionica]